MKVFILSSLLAFNVFAVEHDQSFLVDAEVEQVRNIIHKMKRRDILRIPLFFMAPLLVKENVFNGAIFYDRTTGGNATNIDITAEYLEETGETKVQVIGEYHNEFVIMGHELFSNVRRFIRRQLALENNK